MNDHEFLELSKAEYDVLNDLPVCGCGQPDLAYDTYRRVLRDAVQAADHQSGAEWPTWDDRLAATDGNERLFWIVAYVLDHIEATEHGGSASGAWATDKGRVLLAVLDRYAESDYEAMPTY